MTRPQERQVSLGPGFRPIFFYALHSLPSPQSALPSRPVVRSANLGQEENSPECPSEGRMALTQPQNPPNRLTLPPGAGPVGVALAATLATLLTFAPDAWGPGITCDELFCVGTGKRLVMALRQQGLSFVSRDNIHRNFPWKPGDPPFHPPLGYWILGWMHHLFDPAPDDPSAISILSARFAPAMALGLLAMIVGLYTSASEGALAGTVAAAAVVLVPRVFGHGHLAALDMLTTLFFVAAVMAVACATERGGRVWHFAPAGFVWGLAMLTRLHGVLLFPPVTVWLIWRLRRKAVLPLLVWLAAGMVTLFVGWPWLWLAPIDHFRQFLGTGTARQALHVFYAGQVWADRAVPRHYAIVMFLAVLPLGLLLMGSAGVWARRRAWKGAPGFLLVMGTLVFVLLLFACPGTPVYDGVRLFLMVFPLWAIAVGIGAKWLVEHQVWRSVPARVRLTAVSLFVALQGVGLFVYHPSHLSHYSLLVGGLWGAEKLGFEVTYWGDAVREPLLAEAATRAPGQQVFFAPNLAPFQAPGVNVSSPALLEHRVELIGWDEKLARSSTGMRYAVVYHRKADFSDVAAILDRGRVVREYRKQGVWLARLVEIPPYEADER